MITEIGGNPPEIHPARLPTIYSPNGGIDLNDAGEQKQPQQYDLDELSDKLAERAAEWVPEYFPRGRINNRGDELRLANIRGAPPRKEGSCVIHLKGDKAGSYYDHSTGQGGQPLSTLAEATGLRGPELFERAAEIVGTAKPRSNGHDIVARPVKTDEERARDIQFILSHCHNAQATPVETYLQARGLYLPTDQADLLYHPSLTDWEAKLGRPAMVAIIRDPVTGNLTGGIHRTYLTDDGLSKADMPKPKMMLGPSAGVVMLMPIGEDGVLGLGEGIETSLAGAKLFGVPAWAALSAGNMRSFKFPSGLKRLLIFADKGTDGEAAAKQLHDRAREAGILADILRPKSDDDFAKDMVEGLWKDTGTPPEPEIIPPPQTETELIEFARTLTADAPELHQVLRACVPLDPLARSRVIDALKRATRIGATKLEQQVKLYRKEAGHISRSVGPRPAWADSVMLRENGEALPTQFNAALAIREDEGWRGVLARNDFTGVIRLRRCPPWPNADWSEERDWTDADTLKATEWVQGAGICTWKQTISDAVESVANENRFHPVRDWLRRLEWDGKPRLDLWLLDHCGVEDSRYIRAVGSRFLISAVARIYQPGCKADCVLIFEGKQGAGKSSTLRVLFDGDDRGWFTDEIADLGTKDSAMQLRGVWAVELAELDVMRRAEVSRLKAFTSRTNDRYRPPYARTVVDVPRQCVFAGSVNDDQYLRDPSGGRRFWPVKCLGSLDPIGLFQVREQLWGEAVARYIIGEKWWLHEPDLIAVATDEQADRELRDPWEEPIQNWLDGQTPQFAAAGITTGQILEGALGKKAADWTHIDKIRVGNCVGPKWESRQRRRSDGRRERRYCPVADGNADADDPPLDLYQ